MTLEILYFAWLRERIGAPRERVETSAATVADLVAELVARDDRHAAALSDMRAIRVAGLTVGRDVSLIAHDDVFPYLSPDNLVPAVTTTQSPIRAAGARIGDMALRLLQGEAAEALAARLHRLALTPVELRLKVRVLSPLI